jgi:hypothetical protein
MKAWLEFYKVIDVLQETDCKIIRVDYHDLDFIHCWYVSPLKNRLKVVIPFYRKHKKVRYIVQRKLIEGV